MKNIALINASAGTGKTYSLTERIVQIISSGTAPEELMATTFTKRAAAELEERIRQKLLEGGQAEAAYRIKDGFIGTVNSICARLLKEYALEAGISPAIAVMPEEDGAFIFKLSIDRVVERYADDMEPAARRLELAGGGGQNRNEDWREHVRNIVGLARSNLITPEGLRSCAARSWDAFRAVLPRPCADDLDGVLGRAVAAAVDTLSRVEDIKKTTQGVLDTLSKCQLKIADGTLPWSDWVRLSKLKPAKDGQAACEPVLASAGNVLRHPVFHDDIRKMITGVFGCAADALSGYDEYKQKHGLMDFTDQETRVLGLARDNASFRASLGGRIRTLLVDEFQDTSPVQLALFLALNELTGQSVWVGDPKQAIYGFRGTDPQLMEEVVTRIGDSGILGCSWRSRENLLDFTNALFTGVFHAMGRDKVFLSVPEERAARARGGCLEAWHLLAKNAGNEAMAAANGVRDLIERVPGILPGDIAVLCRTNDACTKIAACLESLGIRASVGQGKLLDTRECRLALAALRYMNNLRDEPALAEIIRLLGNGGSGEWLSELMSDPEAAKAGWHGGALAARLNEGRGLIRHLTPLEALEQAIDRAGLPRRLRSWPNPGLAMGNLDALRKHCREYLDLCESRRAAATVQGFIAYMGQAEAEQAQGIGSLAVRVLTYHKAKGLEWPWVVLTGLDREPGADVFGVNIEAAPRFDPENPLAGRMIRYWPWPFGAQRQYEPLDSPVNGLPLASQAAELSVREAQRLMYVGMTRARDGLVLAMRKSESGSGASLMTGWLDALTGADGQPMMEFPTDPGKQTVRVGEKGIPFTAYEYGPEPAMLPGLAAEKEEYLPVLPDAPAAWPAARLAPSGLSPAPGDEGYAWETLEDFRARVPIRGKPEMDLLGSAVHACLAAGTESLPPGARLRLILDILKNWGMDASLDPADVDAAIQRFAAFLDKRYPVRDTFREWPMTLRTAEGQTIQGWMDLLLDMPDGYVIIDHKDYPGQDAAEAARKYIPQLNAYRAAVELSSGRPVAEVLLHLPVQGRILRLVRAGG